MRRNGGHPRCLETAESHAFIGRTPGCTCSLRAPIYVKHITRNISFIILRCMRVTDRWTSHAIIHRTNGDSIETSGPRLHGKRNRNRNRDRIITEIVTVIELVMSPTPPSRRLSHARGMSSKRSATSAAPALAVALSSHGDR